MTRTPQEVFAHHGKALVTGDLDEIVADYADDLQRTANRTTGIDHQFWQLVANHMRDLTV